MAKRSVRILSFFLLESVTAQNGTMRALLSSRLQWPGTTFDVTQFGAIGDGKADDTPAIQAAFNAIMQEGQGQVVFPPGKYYFGPVSFSNLKDSRIQFKKGSELYLMKDHKKFKSYNGGEGHPKWIIGKSCKNLEVTGGIFHGNSDSWPKPKHGEDDRPGMFKFNGMQGLNFHDAEIYDTPHGNVDVGGSDDVYIHDLKIQSREKDENSPNTICIGLGDVTNAVVTDVDVQCGDDGLKVAGESSNVTFKDSTVKGAHGLSVGSDSGGLHVQDITFSNIKLVDMSIGCRFKITAETEGYAKRITWEKIRMTNVNRPISVHTSYNGDNKDYKTKKFDVGDLYFSDIKAKYDDNEEHVQVGKKNQPGDLGFFSCDDSSPCKKLHLTDIEIKGSDAEWTCEKAQGTIKNVSPKLSCLSSSDLAVV